MRNMVQQTADPPTLLRRESLTEQAAQAIREAILRGDYQLGQKLTEAELSQRFHASNSVIREALHRLIGEGLVTARPYCGCSVFDVPAERVSELMVLRASLESFAAYLAAERATPAVCDEIRAAASAMVAQPPHSYSEWVEKELAFHRTIWRAAGNEWFERQLAQVTLPMFVLRIVQMAKTDDPDRLWGRKSSWKDMKGAGGHQALAREIVSGDPIRARKAMILHILPNANELRQDVLGV